MAKYYFSVAIMANMLSMTAMLILLSIAGMNHLSADIGIAQAATAALFYAFSANARTTVLATSNSALAKSILDIRIILLVPLCLGAFWLTSTLGGVETYLAGVLILRRAVEWLIEVNLSEKERLGDNYFALANIIVQSLLFVFASLWLLMKMPYPMFGLFIWAFMPLFLSVRMFGSVLKNFGEKFAGLDKKMAPHFGSSFAIGVSLYVFRLMMIAILGKNVAGDLFAAFAIGGVLGSIFVNAFGPSIAFNEKMSGTFKLPKMFNLLLWIFTGVGLLIYCMSFLKPELYMWTGKVSYFWKAVGLSMIGGVVMVHAQLLRNRLLIHNEHHDLWGPDLLMNMLIIATLPLAYFSLGINAVAGISLLGALLALLFYKSSELKEISQRNRHMAWSSMFQLIIACFVLIPVFIRFDSGLFQSVVIPQAGKSSLMSLPVPISLFLIYLGILLIGSYRVARLSIGMIFFSFLLMVFSTLMASDGQTRLDLTKLILIVQCTLPMGAIVLGEMFKSDGPNAITRVVRAFLYILAFLVPLQLVASWMQGIHTLSGYLYIFSIYQYRDYVPVIFVSAYLWTLFSLWHEVKYRNVLFFISPLMGIYVVAAINPSAMIFLFLGLLIFAITKWQLALEKLPTGLFLIVLASSLAYLSIEIPAYTLADKFNSSALEIVNAWQYYAGDIFDSMKSFFLGHTVGIDRTRFTSAHNYVLDMVRNFGLVSIVPGMVVIGYTVRAAYFARKSIYADSGLLGSLVILTYLLLVDNATQVSLRQPYPGVFTFFLWGLFIARLSQLNVADKQKPELGEYRN